ncbi:hypothetical protein UK99_10410 [Frankia casuarinae]|nr:hypothetical protein KBI5_08955 [Frankia sp. KB5]ORT96121.1 hypothetical protein UK99_10410 [Frankia casuarinae]
MGPAGAGHRRLIRLIRLIRRRAERVPPRLVAGPSPTVRPGRSVSILNVASGKPRAWTDGERDVTVHFGAVLENLLRVHGLFPVGRMTLRWPIAAGSMVGTPRR